MEGEHRRPRGRAKDPGRTHDRSDEAVEERRLAGPRGTADDDERGRVHLSEPREEIVVDLRDEVVPRTPCFLGPRQNKVEPDCRQVVTEATERRRQVRSHCVGLPATARE
jgi:hypothetical protein